jgi:hypothetical protein
MLRCRRGHTLHCSLTPGKGVLGKKEQSTQPLLTALIGTLVVLQRHRCPAPDTSLLRNTPQGCAGSVSLCYIGNLETPNPSLIAVYLRMHNMYGSAKGCSLGQYGTRLCYGSNLGCRPPPSTLTYNITSLSASRVGGQVKRSLSLPHSQSMRLFISRER